MRNKEKYREWDRKRNKTPKRKEWFRKRSKNRYYKNLELSRKKNREKYYKIKESNPGQHRLLSLRRAAKIGEYLSPNISADELTFLIQNAISCKCCLKVFKSDFDKKLDHNHKTGQVRGIVCAKCNLAFGVFEDLNLEKYLKYLDMYLE